MYDRTKPIVDSSPAAGLWLQDDLTGSEGGDEWTKVVRRRNDWKLLEAEGRRERKKVGTA
jgi:hypothetical protein